MKNLFLALGAVVLILAACKKEDSLPEAARLFRPVAKEGLVSQGNWISASWQQIKGATSYTIQISRDTFRTVDFTLHADTSYALFENLKWNQLYQVQVRANAADSLKNSGYSNLGSIKTVKFPTILNSPTINDVNDEAVKVSWTNSGAAVTSIKVLKASDSSVVKEVALTSTDVTNQFKVVSGLSGSTTYIIYLYSGTTLRGWDNYTTKAPLSGIIVDLRGITDRPSVLQDTLPLIPNGSTVILKRGLTYNITTTLNLDKSVKIVSGSDLLIPDPATIYLTSNFNIAAGSTIDFIEFNNVVLRGSDYTSKYVFNISNASTIGTIRFESCKAEIFRGMTRLQTAVINVENFIINNSIVDSISNYGVINVDNTNCKINNISITNSTIYKAEKIITSKQNSNSVILDNCTINEAPWPGNYMIDYSTSPTNNVAMPIKITNCIFGKAKDKPGVSIFTFSGFRAGATTSVDASNNFSTSDFTGTSSPIPSITSYSRSSTELWQDPLNGNFTIKDNSFPGRNNTGDPRWRP